MVITSKTRGSNGCNVYRGHRALFCAHLGICRRLRTHDGGGEIMDTNLIAAFVALALLVYLVHALLTAETL